MNSRVPERSSCLHVYGQSGTVGVPLLCGLDSACRRYSAGEIAWHFDTRYTTAVYTSIGTIPDSVGGLYSAGFVCLAHTGNTWRPSTVP